MIDGYADYVIDMCVETIRTKKRVYNIRTEVDDYKQAKELAQAYADTSGQEIADSIGSSYRLCFSVRRNRLKSKPTFKTEWFYDKHYKHEDTRICK